LGKGEGFLRSRIRTFVMTSVIGFLLFSTGVPLSVGDEVPGWIKNERERVMKWRKERDQFFRTHQRSPLIPEEKKRFKGLEYFPFNPNYYFEGPIEREILHINDPKYYATFLTNKGTNKRYIRYGKFRFKLDGKGDALEVYKSILSDTLFVPFKDLTNGKETYEGGRYIDAEILPGYKMVLDFNMAYFPSCAYNDKFTCALPPEENFLKIQIRAGEKNHKEEKPYGLK
jgi:uncharacterized protein (DUF1684 family)